MPITSEAKDNYVKEEKAEIDNNWNTILLPTEEIILTRTPEEVCNKKIINPLLDVYRKNIERNIIFYPELKDSLEKRLSCIENFVKLKKILANSPSTNEQRKNNPFFDTEKNTLKQLVRELIQHSEYIQTHRISLANNQIPEDHIQPLLFNLLAEAFDHLAVLNWNNMDLNPNDPNPEKLNSNFLSILSAYEARLKYLKAEKKCLSNIEMRTLCDEKISTTLKNIDETIRESFIIRKRHLAEDTNQNNNDGGFFKCKKPKLSPTEQTTKPQENQRP